MLAGKYKNAFRIVCMTLALAMTVFSESALAEKTRGEDSKKGGSARENRQVSEASPSRQSRPSSNDHKATTNVTVRSQAVKSQTNTSVSKPSQQSSSIKISAQSIRQARSVLPSSSSAVRVRSSSRASKPIGRGFTSGKQVSVKADNQISSGITSRIGSKIINRQSLSTTVEKSPSTGVSSTNPARTDSVGGAIGIKSTSAGNTAERQAISPGARINIEKRERIISPISEQKATVTVVQKPSNTPSSSPVRSNNIQGITNSRSGHKTSSAAIVSLRKNDSKVTLTDTGRSNRINSDRASRIGSVVGAGKPSAFGSREHIGDSKPKNDNTTPARSNNSGVLRSSKSNDKRLGKIADGRRGHKNIIGRVFNRLSAGSEPRKIVSSNLKTSVSSGELRGVSKRDVTDEHRFEGRHFSPRVYKERSEVVQHVRRNEHVYRDYYDRICHRIVRPKYHFTVYYNWGPRFRFSYVYPYYLRKYVFVSLGGYWPIEYSCVRYYWYGCHPYRWYGYYPIAREIKGNTYTYYTYNYYYNGTTIPSYAGQIVPVDHTTFADVREKLALQGVQGPGVPTLADTFFDEGVSTFEAGDYRAAVEKFARAMGLAPDDMILPFAYSQALLANEQYSEAADVLRTVLAEVSPEKEGVFYPRGLYPDEEVLLGQIDCLKEAAESFSFDADLQLLLGYQLLGIGEIDQAVEPLLRASEDLENAPAANILLELLEKIKAGNSEAQNTGQ